MYPCSRAESGSACFETLERFSEHVRQSAYVHGEFAIVPGKQSGWEAELKHMVLFVIKTCLFCVVTLSCLRPTRKERIVAQRHRMQGTTFGTSMCPRAQKRC